MVVCPNCQSQQPDGTVFCDNCGAKLNAPQVAQPQAAPAVSSAPTVVASNCPQCGQPVNPGNAFCDNCGASLGPAAQSSAGPQPVGQEAGQPAAAPPSAGGLTCSNCGAQLTPGSAFCDMCGAPVASGQQQAASPPYQQQTPQPQQPPYQQQPQQQPYQQPQQQAYQPPQPAPQPGAGAFGAQASLVVQKTGAQLSLPSGKAEIIVGREDVASNIFPDIDLNDHGGDEGGVSRRHARITQRSGQFYIEDMGSVNYTFVNRQKLSPNQPHPINSGDEIQLGRVKLNFQQ